MAWILIRKRQMNDYSGLKDELARKKEKIEGHLALLSEKLTGAPERLIQAMLYSLSAGGKRLRPAICMASAEFCGLNEDQVLPFACAIELIHTYSLIHDDLPAMDDDDMRRGRPSCHKQFDEATAILAGDALLTDAFWLISSVPLRADLVLAALAELARAAGSTGMAGGQTLDMIYTGQKAVSLEQIAHMQELKTGAILRASAVCGAILAGASQERLNILRQYGESLGRAFQIADDILDLTATTQEIGKPAGSDLAKGKITYPALIGIAESCKLAMAEAEKAASLMPDTVPGRFLADLALYAANRGA